jgi:hypothetical protein
VPQDQTWLAGQLQEELHQTLTYLICIHFLQVEAQLVDYSAQSLWDGSQAPVTARVTIQPAGAMGELAQQLRGGSSVEAKPLQFAGGFICYLQKGQLASIKANTRRSLECFVVAGTW